MFEDCEEEMMSEFTDVTVTAKGLATLTNEILHLRDDETRRVRDGHDKYGNRAYKEEKVPFEEKFQEMNIRVNGDKFTVRVSTYILDTLNTHKARADKASEWENIS